MTRDGQEEHRLLHEEKKTVTFSKDCLVTPRNHNKHIQVSILRISNSELYYSSNVS